MVRLQDELRQRGFGAAEARGLLSTGKVFLSGVPTGDPGREVVPETVEVRPSAPRLVPGRDLVLLWHDAHLAVVVKPAGMLSVPAPGRDGETCVVGEVQRLLGAGLPVHRLDEPTSGVMMVARTETCRLAIKELLFHHRIERRYLAIVRGRFPSPPRTVRSTMVRDRGDGRRGSAEDDDSEGREAVTHLRILEALGNRASVVAAQLETGRTHQVRIHLAEAGHPVLGDDLYGDRSVAGMAPRLALHALVLGLTHPITGEALRFEVPLADDLEQLRRRLAREQAGHTPGRRGGRRRK